MAINPISVSPYQMQGDLNFSSLSQLPQLWQQGQARQTLSSLQRLPDGSINTAPLYASGDMSLANLAVQLDRNKVLDQRDSRDFQFRQDEAQRSQRNADRTFALQQASNERQNMSVEETAAERAKAARANGVDPTTPAGRAYILTGKLPEGDQNFAQVVAQRQQAAQANGLDPSSPGYQSFVLTGKMPREDAQPLTAGDKEAIRTADDAVLANRSAIDSLKRAKELSKQAFTGPTAGVRGYVASFLGEGSDLGKAGIATENLTNEVMTNALGQLKSIFGGNPTEGERKILLELQGSAKKNEVVRREIFDRAIGLAEKRLEFNQKRADELRGNTYYKPKGQQAPAAPSGVVDYRTYFGAAQ